MKTAARIAWAAALLLAARAQAADGWTHLRPGMTREEASAALGDPLMKNSGRGFEVWLYDGRGELVCYRGVVLGWTAPQPPAPAPVRAAPVVVAAPAPKPAARVADTAAPQPTPAARQRG